MQHTELEKKTKPKKLTYFNSAMQALTEMSPVDGSELDLLLFQFHESVKNVAEDGTAFSRMCEVLHEINPYFAPETHSLLPEANVLANVVAGLYSPLVHGFSNTIFKNIKAGKLPELIIAPPRDTVPLVVSLEAIAEITGHNLKILKPPVTRKTAGIPNNQSDKLTTEDPLFKLMIQQNFEAHLNDSGLTEVETGIYSTTSLKVASSLKNMGFVGNYVALKFYGLGPNLSYVHALLSRGGEWVAERAEQDGLVEGSQIAQLMVLLDSLEEFGMQNIHQTVTQLKLSSSGQAEPVIKSVDAETLEIARATNSAIKQTAPQYLAVETEELSLKLLNAVPQLVELSQDGYPFTLTAPIPPMDDKEQHFNSIRNSSLLCYPKLIL